MSPMLNSMERFKLFEDCMNPSLSKMQQVVFVIVMLSEEFLRMKIVPAPPDFSIGLKPAVIPMFSVSLGLFLMTVMPRG